MDGSGNLYGTTTTGGPAEDGAIFELAHGSHTITSLASFNGANESDLRAGVIMDPHDQQVEGVSEARSTI
jgi:uncharacterized repeat protein (TIGR03803 family)